VDGGLGDLQMVLAAIALALAIGLALLSIGGEPGDEDRKGGAR